jgi:hypothetical protein
MNWVVVVVFGVVAIAAVNWVASARYTFKCPARKNLGEGKKNLQFEMP